MDSTEENAFRVKEKEPEKESQTESQFSQADPKHIDVSLVNQNQAAKSKDKKITSYEIEASKENPHTMTLPHLVRKVPESDLTPRPWKTFNQILCLSYISVLFFFPIGAFANKYAWKAIRTYRKGLYVLAKKWAKPAVILSYIAVLVGCIVITIIVLAVKKML
ncbi:uncharacterized protein LOC133185910 [Saccostrea echinata]|uniref:uncharacterized protein LOC133185910 n=1 Tax=Saccostrea echinata TaxID=191078 RepID=UPI002A81A8DD|nr:uncharacterized protein LOC133185910 [Saccostrea echinata]